MVADRDERRDNGDSRVERGDRHLDVDDRFRSQTGNRGRADVLDTRRERPERIHQDRRLFLEPRWPVEVVVVHPIGRCSPVRLAGFGPGSSPPGEVGEPVEERLLRGIMPRRVLGMPLDTHHPRLVDIVGVVLPRSIASTNPSGLVPVATMPSPRRSIPWWWCEEQLRGPAFVVAASRLPLTGSTVCVETVSATGTPCSSIPGMSGRC